jgi:hypothetical protein
VKKIIQHIVFVSGAFLLLHACEEPFSPHLQEGPLPKVVIEGRLTNELKYHEIKISKPFHGLNDSTLPVSNATVAVTDFRKFVVFNEREDKPGTYKSASKIRAFAGRKYILHVKIGDMEFTAADSMVPVTTLKPFYYERLEDTFLYQGRSGSDNNPSFTEMYYNWDDVKWYSKATGKNGAKEIIYNLQTLEVNRFFAPGKPKVYFPGGTTIIRRKYSISPLYQEFSRSLLMETEWKGGIFDVLPGNVQTNINNGGAGFFSVHTVVTDTLLVQ